MLFDIYKNNQSMRGCNMLHATPPSGSNYERQASDDMAGIENKAKRRRLSIEDRCIILQRIKDGATRNELAAEFKVTRQAIMKIQKSEKRILNAKHVLENCDGDIGKKLRYSAAEENPLDQKVFEWFAQNRAMGIAVSGGMIRKQCLIYNERLGGNKNFMASDGWLTKFKKRHGLQQKNIHGENLAVDYESREEFKSKLDNIIKVTGIGPDHIYNCDETGLYWRMMPNKTLVMKKEKCAAGRKQPQNRLTVMLCSNASGTHKIPLFIIGKPAKPRCFQGIKKLPVIYESQKSAWMTCDLMRKWYSELFLPEVKKKHDLENNLNVKIILIMDNAGCHPPADELNNMCISCTILSWPANLTTLIQPLHQGIIEKFKKCYKNLLIERAVSQTENGEYHEGDILNSFDLLDCCNFCYNSWDEVTSDNIKNCWKKLIPLENHNNATSHIDAIDATYFRSILSKIPRFGSLSAKEIKNWLNIDSDEPGWQTCSDDDILDLHSNDDIGAVDELHDEVPHTDEETTPTDSTTDEINYETFMDGFNLSTALLNWYQRHGENLNSELQTLIKINCDLQRKVISKKML